MAPSPCPVLLYSSCPWADKSIGIIKMIVDCTLYIFYKSHLEVLSGNLKKCSFQSAIYIMCILHQKGFSISHLKEIQYLTLKSKFSTLHLKAIQYLKLINKFSISYLKAIQYHTLKGNLVSYTSDLRKWFFASRGSDS
jgi:hypothetical protein